MKKYLASFYIGETDGDDDFEIAPSTQFVLENWESRTNARLMFENLLIESSAFEENIVFDEDDGTYLLYLDCIFEINDDQKKLLAPMYEYGAPSANLFSLDCGPYSFICGVVEDAEE